MCEATQDVLFDPVGLDEDCVDHLDWLDDSLKGPRWLKCSSLLLYQSKFFDGQYPLENEAFGKREYIEREGEGDDDAVRAARLAAMREAMIARPDIVAGVFIGGKSGVVDEYERFRELHRDAPVIPVAATGSRVFLSCSGKDLKPVEALYNALTREHVDVWLESLSARSRAYCTESSSLVWSTRSSPTLEVRLQLVALLGMGFRVSFVTGNHSLTQMARVLEPLRGELKDREQRDDFEALGNLDLFASTGAVRIHFRKDADDRNRAFVRDADYDKAVERHGVDAGALKQLTR